MGTHLCVANVNNIRLYTSYSHFIVQRVKNCSHDRLLSYTYGNVMDGEFPAFSNECFHDYLLQHSLILSTVKGQQ